MSQLSAIEYEPAARQSRADTSIGIVLLTALLTIFLVISLQINHRISSRHSGDFRHFYFAAGAFLDHRDLYAPVPIDIVERALGRPADVVERAWYTTDVERYLYPPLIAMLYTPLARLRFDTAQRVDLVVESLLTLAGIFLAARAFGDRFNLRRDLATLALIALLATILNLDKIHLELQMFQTNSLMFFMFALSLYLLDKKPILAGVPLGLIFNIKYLSLGLLPWLLIRRRWWTAGAYVVSTMFFAFVPALISGWSANLHHLSIAYGGLFHMVGASQGSSVEQANVEDIRDYLSCSITSAMARSPLNGGSLQIGMLFSACIAMLSLAVVIWRYLFNRVPLVIWPSATTQAARPWNAVIGLEFTAIFSATLCFSPQTNTRHLMMLLLLFIPLIALFLGARRGVPRFPVVTGAILLAIGLIFPPLIFPPANRFMQAHHMSLLWFGVGGQCWCVLLAVFTLMSVGLAQAKSLGSFSR